MYSSLRIWGMTKTWKFLMVTLGSTRIRTERDGWFLLLNVEVGEIVVTLWRNAKLWSGADPPCFLVSERDVMQQCRVSESLDCQGLLREYVVDVQCLIFLEGVNLNSVLELCSIVIWVLVYYTDFLVGICVCAGCNTKSYSHGFISCKYINMLCIQFWVFLFHLMDILIAFKTKSLSHLTIVLSNFLLFQDNVHCLSISLAIHSASQILNWLIQFVCTHMVERMPQGLPHMCHEPWPSVCCRKIHILL